MWVWGRMKTCVYIQLFIELVFAVVGIVLCSITFHTVDATPQECSQRDVLWCTSGETTIVRSRTLRA